MKTMKWAAIPTLLMASVFSGLAASYAPLAELVICVAAVVLVQRAVWSKHYYWAVGFAATLVAFSPLFLVVKVFALMGFACTVVFMTVLGAFRTRPAPTEIS
jgi:uncharacterized membrane protein